MTPDTLASPSVLDAAWQPDPYPLYAALRERHAASGVYFDAPSGLWVACTAQAAAVALQNPALRVRPADAPVPRFLHGRPAGQVFGGLMRMNEGTDRHAAPKAHAEHRLSAWLPRVSEATQAVVTTDLMPDQRPVNELLFDAPITVVALLLGYGIAEASAVAADARRLVAAWSPLADETTRTLGDAAAQRLLALFDGDANRVGFLTQTCDATAGLLGNAIVAWRRRPDDPHDLPTWVQQVAHNDPAIHNTRRYAHADLLLQGQPIARGDTVLVLLALPGLGFGAGRHACPGEALAQRIVAELLRHWLADAQPALLAQTRRWRYRRLPNARIPEFLTDTDERPLP